MQFLSCHALMIALNADYSGPGSPDAAPATPVAVGLGSNLGDRAEHLARAVASLGDVLGDLRCSGVWETEPVGVPDAQPPYLNLCCVGRTELPPDVLLERLLETEEAAGRARDRRGGGPRPRTLDVDLLLYGEEIVDRPGLEVPHPRMRRRAFVLVPLAEIAGGWTDPVTGRTVAELAQAVDGSGVERYAGELPPELEEVTET